MKYALLALVFLALWTPRAWSEGPWHDREAWGKAFCYE